MELKSASQAKARIYAKGFYADSLMNAQMYYKKISHDLITYVITNCDPTLLKNQNHIINDIIFNMHGLCFAKVLFCFVVLCMYACVCVCVCERTCACVVFDICVFFVLYVKQNWQQNSGLSDVRM